MNTPPQAALTRAAVILTPEAYKDFGDVLSADTGGVPAKANRGTADLVGRLTKVENLRPGSATQNWKIYRCAPCLERPVRVRELEKHPWSTQLFVPMGGAGRYLVVVALGDVAPDLKTLRALVATNRPAITYRPGIWHLPMTVLDGTSDMLSLVYEDGSAGDCVVTDRLPCEVWITI